MHTLDKEQSNVCFLGGMQLCGHRSAAAAEAVNAARTVDAAKEVKKH